MKMPNKIFEKDKVFLDQIDALLGSPEASEDLASELVQFDLDPDELRKVAFQRIRGFATQQYSSRGNDLPIRMSDALSQLRPPTPIEERSFKEESAKSRVQGILAAIKNAGNTFSAPGSFAPAYRNKEDETPESDRKLLEGQQKQLDGEGDDQ
ncbi:MAG: hypothetical protein WA634_06460 [Silvibacterium sp.]